ncbi:bacteriorhodopsin [Paraclostridium sordellii]|nr:bacteriorhodopsin [Paeniclostridium sordellii]
MNQSIVFINYFCAIFMLISTVILFINRDKFKMLFKKLYNLGFLILSISSVLYIIISINFNYPVSDKLIYFNRYLDWILTTPLLLIMLCFIGMYHEKINEKIILRIVIIDVIMILSGLLSDISIGPSKYLWILVGSILFLIVLYILWGPVEKVASIQGCDIYRVYKILAMCFTVFWIGYPIIWVLGKSGLGIGNRKIFSCLSIVTPAVCKVGFVTYSLQKIKDIISLQKK